MNTFLIAFMFSLNAQGTNLTLEYSNSSLGANLYGIDVGVVDHSNGYFYLDSDYKQKIICGNSAGVIRVLAYSNNTYTTDRIWTNSNGSTYGLTVSDVDYRDWMKSSEIITGNSYGQLDITYYSPTADVFFVEGQSAVPSFDNPMTIGAGGADIRGLAVGDPRNNMVQQIIAGDEDGYVHFIIMDYDADDPYGREKNPDLITFSEFCPKFDVGNNAYGIAVGDVDEDGLQEVVVGHKEGLSILEDPTTNAVTLGWNSDDAGIMTSEGNFWGVAVGDTDNDGKNEIVCGTYGGKVYVLDWSGSNYVSTLVANIGRRAYGITIADVDGGTLNEIVACGTDTSGNSRVYVFDYDVNSGNYVQEAVSNTNIDLGSHAGIYGAVAVGDPDGDGQNEIITGSATKLCVLQVDNYGTSGVDTPLNPGSGLNVEWRSTGILPTDDAITAIGVADLKGCGTNNIFLGTNLGWLRALEFDPVTGGYQIEWERRWCYHVYGMAVGPVGSSPGDPMQFCITSSNQKMDTFGWDTNATDMTQLYTETYSTELRIPRDSSLTDWSYGIAVGDVNYSSGSSAPWGREVVVGGADGEVYVFKYRSVDDVYTNEPSVPYLNDTRLHGIAIGDVNGDSENEIVAGGHDQLHILKYNTTNTEYEVIWESDSAGMMTNEGNFFGLAIGNIDDDSDNEIVCCGYHGLVYVLDCTSGTNYTATLVKDVGYRGYAVAIGDLDGIPGNEFVVIGNNNTSTAGNAHLFKYNSSLNKYDQIAKSTEYLGCSAGSFSAIGIGDVDSDGTNEIVIGSANMVTVLQYRP